MEKRFGRLPIHDFTVQACVLISWFCWFCGFGQCTTLCVAWPSNKKSVLSSLGVNAWRKVLGLWLFFFFKAHFNIGLSEMQSKKAKKKYIYHFEDKWPIRRPMMWGTINWETEHDGGPVSSRADKGQSGWWTITGQCRGQRGQSEKGRWNRGLVKIKYSRLAKRATLILYHCRVFMA